MSPDTVLINTPNFNFCLSSSKTQVHQFKKDIPKSSIQYSIMTAKKNQLSHARIKYALKDSSFDTPLSKIFERTILDSNASSSST